MSTQLTTQPEGSAVALIREAIASGKSPEYLRELLNVRRDWETDEARKAFNLSISEFQCNDPTSLDPDMPLEPNRRHPPFHAEPDIYLPVSNNI